MDWMDKTREDRYTFEMIDPFNLNISRGYLEHVQEESVSLTFGYYTDTRVSGKLTAVDHNYVEGSLIRIHHYTDEEGYQKTLGTFFVSSHRRKEAETFEEEFTLVSMMSRVSDDVLPWDYAISNSKLSIEIIKDLCDKFNVDYKISSDATGKYYTNAVVYEVGENVLSVLYDIASESSWRLDVDGDLVGGYCCSYGVAKVLSSFNPFSNSSDGEPVLSSMDSCKYLPLNLSCSIRVSRENAISGS